MENNPSSFTICEKKGGTDDCIYPSSVLSDLYGIDPLNASDDYTALPDIGIASIIKSIKFNDGTDTYAFFFIALNQFYEKMKITTCHSCSPILGISAYQFHNSWKPFSKNSNLGNYGSWGKLYLGPTEDKKNSLNIYPIEPERFLITISTTDGGQGYMVSTLDLIMMTSGQNMIPINMKPIESLGYIKTGFSDCSGIPSKDLDWKGKVSFDFEKNKEIPIVHVTRTYYKTCSETILNIPSKTFDYTYDWRKNKYVASGLSGDE